MESAMSAVGAPPRHLAELEAQVQEQRPWLEAVTREIHRVVVGQDLVVERVLIALLAGGHLLLEGVPGLAKTLLLKTLAGALDGELRRVQFTPDMLPADIIGTLVYNPRTASFETKHGPIFANFILADEINRAPAKVQSALLEAMQEHQVTLGETSHRLPSPFLVMATQNPIEQEGTYPLPEAQMDRFMMKLRVGYPTAAEERHIVDAMAHTRPDTSVSRVAGADAILAARALVDRIHVDDRVRDYAVDLVRATRDAEGPGQALVRYLRYGASPRASIALVLAARARAFLAGRAWVAPHDVKALAADVLRHRVGVTYEAEAQGVDADAVVAALLDLVPTP
ncbi:MAG: AAA family ATPase [Deltaproteobacteria bacterium]|nr:AAA family ATPase [Deltaproteobacteria bacterium]